MKTSTSSKKSLAKGMLIYAVVFLILAAIGLKVFWSWAEHYEQSRPSYAIKNYINDLTEDHVRTICAEMLSILDFGSTDEEKCINTVYNMIKSSTPAKNVPKSSDSVQVYLLKYGDSYIEQLTMTPGPETKFGFKPWIVSNEELFTDNLISESSVSVPEDWTVSLNSKILDSNYIEGGKKELSLLNGFYEEFSNLPYIVNYSTGLHFGDENLTITSPTGKTYQKSDLSEEVFTDNCSGDEKAALDDFCKEYISRYVNYTSVGVSRGQGAYYYLLALVDPSSQLYKQIRESIQGFGYASSLGDSIQDIRILEHMSIGDNRYVCRIEYDIETYGSHHSVTDQTYPMRLVVEDINGEYKAIAYLNY